MLYVSVFRGVSTTSAETTSKKSESSPASNENAAGEKDAGSVQSPQSETKQTPAVVEEEKKKLLNQIDELQVPPLYYHAFLYLIKLLYILYVFRQFKLYIINCF